MLEFEEFCCMAARFLMEEDEDALRNELKEAFRIYDKEEKGYTTQHSSVYTQHTEQTTLSVYTTH